MAAVLEKSIDVYVGLSSDSKATIASPRPGSIFIETDTTDIYKYNAGDITWYKLAASGSATGTAPYLTLWNTTHEDTSGGRESRIIAKGEQSGGEVTTLGYIEFSHEGALDDEKGQLRIYLNDGNDGNAPSKLGATFASTGASTLTDLTLTSIQCTKTIYFDAVVDNGNSGVAQTIIWSAGNFQRSTLTGDCEFTFTDPPGTGECHLKLIQDGTGGRTVTWPASVRWPSGLAPVLSVTAGAVDRIRFIYDGTNYDGSRMLDYQ